MRLFEITTPRWYIIFNEKQQLGSIIERYSSVYPLGALLEGHLERRRPKDRLCREKSFYLLSLPPSCDAYVYEVEPTDQIDRQHTGWLQLLRNCTQTNIGEADHYATGYWSDKEVPELRDAPWEYRVAKVKLLRQLGAPGPAPLSITSKGTSVT